MTLVLYNFAGSTCSQAVRFCLAEKDIAWEDHRMVFKTGEHLSPAYLKLNPNGVVPTLVHDGQPITESTVIMEYLDEEFPEHSMTPRDSVQRAKMRAWLRYLEEVPTPAVRYPSFQRFIGRVVNNETYEKVQDLARRHPVRKDFYSKFGKQGFSQKDLGEAMEKLRQTIDRAEAAIAEEGPWLLGGQLTLADAYLLPVIDRLNDLGMADMWEKHHPNVTRWYANIQKRPAFKETYYKGARLSESYGAEPARS